MFTETEIEEDLNVQQKIIQIQNILSAGGNKNLLDLSLIDKDELIKNMPQNLLGSMKMSAIQVDKYAINIEKVDSHKSTDSGKPSDFHHTESKLKSGNLTSKKKAAILMSQRISNIKEKKKVE